jgi:hypothetical protein
VEINKGESYEAAWTLAAVVHLLLAYSHVIITRRLRLMYKLKLLFVASPRQHNKLLK